MKAFLGLDVANEVHWACAIGQDARPVCSRGVKNDPDGIADRMSEVQALDADDVALALLGGIATLVWARRQRRIRASVRASIRSGENQSDPRDAHTISELAPTGRELRGVDAANEIDVDIRLLIGRRRELVQDQTRRVARLRDLLSSLFPALARRIDINTKTVLSFLSLHAAPHELRSAKAASVAKKVTRTSPHLRGVLQLAEDAITLAKAQPLDVPGAATRAGLVRDMAAESLAARETRERIDREIADMLVNHPDAALIQSLPGRGVVLTAALIANIGDTRRFSSADALAAAAGLTPVLLQSGKFYGMRRASSGNKALKHVFYQSAFVTFGHPGSKAFYDLKRREGKRHNQAAIALARRRINVVWAMLTTRQPFTESFTSRA